MDELAIVKENGAVQTVAQANRALNDRIENRLHIARRARNDPQDLAGGGLPTERLRQVAVAGLQLLEQAHVLDGDDGLVGEGLEQRDLTFREAPNLGAPGADCADCHPFAHQRQGDHGPVPVPSRDLAALWKLVPLSLQIGDMNRQAFQHRAAVGRPADKRDRELAKRPGGYRAVMSDEEELIALPLEDL